jgi:uncharacterized protein (TIGR03905 family)
MFEPIKLSDLIEDGIRKASFKTSDAVCSLQIDIELEGETIGNLQYTKGCHGNTQGIASLCAGMKASDVIARLSGIDCKARGTSCPDQLARALRQLL